MAATAHETLETRPLLAVESISRTFGGVNALDNISFVVTKGRIHALIGPNGAGKTTLFNIIAGVLPPTSGRVYLGGDDVTDLPTAMRARAGLQRTFQNLQTFSELNALETVMVGQHLHLESSFLKALFGLPVIQRSNARSYVKAEQVLERVGLATYKNSHPGSMPYGALKRLDIARALAADPILLLMDEPAAGLNPAETETMRELIAQIAAEGVTIILVEHDMKLVMKLADEIVVLDHGQKIAQGAPAEISRDPNVVRAYLGVSLSRRKHR